MKLYIWNDAVDIHYGGAIMIVAAPNLTEARKQARKARHVKYSAHPSDGIVSLPDLGPPDAVIDAPAAVLYEWSE